MTRKPTCLLYTFMLAFGLVAGFASNAFSWYQLQHGSACSVAFGSPSNFVGWGNTSSDAALYLNCSMPDSNHFPKAAARADDKVAVYVRDGHPDQSILASRCVEWWSIDGASCGSSDISENTGTQSLNPPNSDQWYWTVTDDHFGYVLVVLPRKFNSATSIIKGITDVD